MDVWDAALRAATLMAVLFVIPRGIGALVGWAYAGADPERAREIEPGAALDARLGALPGLVVAATLVGLGLVPPPHAHGPESPLSLVAALGCAVLVAFACLHGEARRARRGLGGPLLAGALLGALPAVAIGAALLATRVEASPLTVAGADEARARVLVVPWDPAAQLALGFDAARRDDLAAADARLEAAERGGADEVGTLELRAELEARRGDCTAARRAFDRALSLRAARAMADVLERPLSAADYALPEGFVRLCGVDEGSLSGP